MQPNWFIGVPVDGTEWYERWIDDAPDGVRRFAPADLHITVAFLGGVGRDTARRAWDAVGDHPVPAVEVTFHALEPFGNPKRPSALALTLDRGRDRLVDALLTTGADALAAAGRPPSRYSPRPHCTVARPPRKATHAQRAEAIAWAREKAPPSVTLTLDELALYTWSEDRREKRFRIIHRRHGAATG